MFPEQYLKRAPLLASPDSFLFRQGERQENIFFLQDGIVRAVHVSPEGAERVKEFYFAKEYCFLYLSWLAKLPAPLFAIWWLSSCPDAWRLSTSLLAVHFTLLDQKSAAAMLLLASLRYVIATWTTHRNIAGLFCLPAICCSVLTWRNALNLLPLAGSLLMTLAAFKQDDVKLRLYTLAGSLFWLTNNLLCHSPVAAIMALTFISSTLVSLYRIYHKKIRHAFNSMTGLSLYDCLPALE